MADSSTAFSGPPEGVQAINVSAPFYYGFQPPEGGLNADSPLLIALHGWGQNCRYFLRLLDTLRASPMAVVTPQAPHQFYLDMESRKVGFGWLTAYDRNRGILHAVDAIDHTLDTITATTGWQPRHILVLGFSQGVSMAWRYAFHGRHTVQGVIACGGDLPPDIEAVLHTRPPRPTLIVHGRDDTVVPIEKGHHAESTLRANGYPVETDYFTGAHEIPVTLPGRLSTWPNP